MLFLEIEDYRLDPNHKKSRLNSCRCQQKRNPIKNLCEKEEPKTKQSDKTYSIYSLFR